MRRSAPCCWLFSLFVALAVGPLRAEDGPPPRRYVNLLTRLQDESPILADHPRYVEPLQADVRYRSPPLVNEEKANLSVRAWRYSYNVGGIVENTSLLRSEKTAIVIVHPWGVDDGQGWRTPQPAGAAFFCTPVKNAISLKHAKEVIDPFLKKWRDRVGQVVYSLPGKADGIRDQLYRTTKGKPSQQQRRRAKQQLEEKLKAFDYRGEPTPSELALRGRPAISYFKQFPGLSAGDRFNGRGFWQLPIPVMSSIEVSDHDVVLFDEQGYDALRKFLKEQGIEHVLLGGYATDMCVCSTTAGFENLRRDFNVFLVGDATMATFPASTTPRYATQQAICKASLDLLITQVSWIRDPKRAVRTNRPLH